MEVEDGNKTPAPAPDVDWTNLADLQRPFDAVSADLAALGALSVEDFLSNATTSSTAFDVAFYVQLPEPPPLPENSKDQAVATAGEPDETEESKANGAQSAKALRGMVTMLHQASHSVFGSSDCLKFEYLEDDPKNKQCILTITRPNGATRSYKSDSGFSRRGDAKAQASKIAVEMGAIDFIVSGDSDALKARKGLLLNPFDVEIDNMGSNEAVAGTPLPKFTEEEEPLKLIDDCCVEWRAGKVKPHWVAYNDAKNKKKHGAAVRISLSAHAFRAYSVDPIYNTQKAAKIACAKSALLEGVIEFIQHGNGQTQPPKVIDDGLEEMMNLRQDSPPPLKGITLQEFYETLPQPFPEDVGEMSVNEINAPAWLNVTLQSARGGRLVSSFTPVVDSVRHLHGCILRIERPGETKTFLVDPQFPKRSDAKSAVCLLAMSQGVGDYIRDLKEEAENKLPANKRKLANEKLLQVLAAECSKVRQGNRPMFSYTTERDAFGCTLKVDISGNTSAPDVRQYSVGSEYRTKADAKAAVACHAAEQGLIDLLRFRGAPPPPDYVPFWEAQMNGDGDNYIAKRKEPERDLDGEGRDHKKRRKATKDTVSERGEVSGLRPGMKAGPPVEGLLPRKPNFLPANMIGSTSKPNWKKPRATGSSGLGPTNAYASAPRSVGQDRSGNRSGGPSHPHPPPPRGYQSMSSSSMSSSYPPPSRPYDDRIGYGPDPMYQPGPQYSHPDPYGPPYLYPTPASAHYSSSAYHSPPPPPPPPQPPHHYPAYYGTPSSAPPTPPHAPYGHYPYQHQYPPQYPNAQYSGNYPPHPPVHYSPPPPPSQMAPVYPPMPLSTAPSDYYPARFRSPYSPHSPRPARSPPYSPLHAPNYPPYEAYETDRSTNHRRRHTTIEDTQPRANGHHVHSRQYDHDRRQWDRHAQENQTDARRQNHGRHPPSTSTHAAPSHVGQNSRSHNSRDVSVKKEVIERPSVRQTSSKAESKDTSASKTNLDILYDFCRKENVQKPRFLHELVEDKEGTKKYSVWAEKDSQRLELQTLFSTFEEGQERLSKQVLQWERSRLKQRS